jgi:surfeit locus 1 family protein
MLRASYWQWERHQEKLEYIQKLEERLELPPVPLRELLDQIATDLDQLLHRRVLVEGRFDFSQEMILKNRRVNDEPGVFAITPLALNGTNKNVLVNRGFLPFASSSPEKRKPFQKEENARFTGLVKLSSGEMSSVKKLLAPADPPTGKGHARVDAWLRVDTKKMEKQLPYQLLPIYLELMDEVSPEHVRSKVISTEAGREEMLVLPAARKLIGKKSVEKVSEYPIPSYTTVIPPGRHFGYIFEWAFMALGTLLIGMLLQLRPSRQHHIPI